MSTETETIDPAELTPRAVRTRERILDAAETVFVKSGFDAATTREIAGLSETNVATTYRYFPSKEALYEAVIQRAVEPLVELMDEFDRSRDEPDVATQTNLESMSRLAIRQGTTRLVYRELVSTGAMGDRIREQVFQPLFDRVRAEVRGGGNVPPDMEPFVSALFFHLSFSHVALAPLLSEIFDRDMLSPESIQRQVRILDAVARTVLEELSEE